MVFLSETSAKRESRQLWLLFYPGSAFSREKGINETTRPRLGEILQWNGVPELTSYVPETALSSPSNFLLFIQLHLGGERIQECHLQLEKQWESYHMNPT